MSSPTQPRTRSFFSPDVLVTFLCLAAIAGAVLFAWTHASTFGAAETQPSVQIGQVTASQGAPLYSDDELNSMLLKVVTVDDFRSYPPPAVKLAPGTRVEHLNDLRSTDLRSPGGPLSPTPFERVRVINGIAKDRTGWVQVGSVN